MLLLNPPAATSFSIWYRDECPDVDGRAGNSYSRAECTDVAGRADRSPLLALRLAAETTVASCGRKLARSAERMTRNRSAVPVRGCRDAARLDQILQPRRNPADGFSPPDRQMAYMEAICR